MPTSLIALLLKMANVIFPGSAVSRGTGVMMTLLLLSGLAIGTRLLASYCLIETDNYYEFPLTTAVVTCFRILYFIVSYSYISCSGSLTSVWKERANFSAIVYL